MLEIEDNTSYFFNSFPDDHIQQRLFEADDELFVKEVLNVQNRANQRQKNPCVNTPNNNAVSVVVIDNASNKSNNAILQKYLRDNRAAPICGWFVDPDIIYRKSEIDGPSKLKFAAGCVSKENVFSRDSKKRHSPSQDFVFRHYTDPSSYIQQYRQQHICYHSKSTSATRNDVIDLQKCNSDIQHSPDVAFSQTSVLQGNTTQQPLSAEEQSFVQNSERLNQTQQKPQKSFSRNYVNKLQQQKQTISANVKTTKKSNYYTSDEAKKTTKDQVKNQVQRSSSAKVQLLTLAVSDMKLNTTDVSIFPSQILQLPRPGSPLDPTPGNRFLGTKLGIQPGVVDTLGFSTRNGIDKQSSGIQEINGSSETQLGSHNSLKKWDSKPKPFELHLTQTNKGEEQPQSLQKTDVSETVQVQLSKSRSEFTSKANSAGCDLQNRNEKSRNETDSLSEQKLLKKEKSMLAVTGHCCKARKYVYDRWAIAKKEDKRSLISHNQKIRHLIRQSKLKHKYDHVFSPAKAYPDRSILEISSIQIVDPFTTAVPNSDQNGNVNNCSSTEDNSNALVTCHRGFTISNSYIKGNIKSVHSEHRIHLSDILEDSPVNQMEEWNNFPSNADLIKSNKKSDQKGCIRSIISGQTNHRFVECSQSDDDSVGSGSDQDCHEILRDPSWTVYEKNCFHRGDEQTQNSSQKGYLNSLAKQISGIVGFKVPKFRYSKFPSVYRSESLNL